MMEREQILEQVRATSNVSVLIIGGGVNGIGTFRDLALQGVDVLLVERSDFGSGASAASSHMLHGGIRYLENGEFRLVREALTERNLMLKNAPHYAKPLPTTIPIFRWFSGFFNAPLKFLRLRDKPSERGAAVIKIGLILYDIFARSYRVMPTHEVHLRKKSLELYPKLNPEIVCTASYYDAWMPYPERICLELVLDAESASGNAHALNYVSAVDCSGDTVTLRDELSGETFTVKPQVVVNAAGPWIDFANRVLGKPTNFIGGTKGSHIILDHPELHDAANGHEIFFENNDGRIVLILPYLGKVMVGTTDIRIDDPDKAYCTDEEVDYMLGLVKKVFPSINVDRSQIVYKFSGVRPLPSSDKSYTGNVSRDHSITTLEPSDVIQFPIFSLVGGKWTTFRAFSEQAADKVLDVLNRKRVQSTANIAIGGGKGFPSEKSAWDQWIQQVGQQSGVALDRVRVLLERYGTRAENIVEFIAAGEDAPIHGLEGYSRRELLFLATFERVEHLDDLLLRRTLIGWMGQLNVDILQQVAGIAAEALDWDDARTQEEIERTTQLLERQHGVDLGVKVQ
jgi:glycerol-3-phosphate dehydrogenase